MTISIEVKLKPFTVPNFVIPERPPGRRQDGLKFDEGIPVHTLSDDTLLALCNEFRENLMAAVRRKRTELGTTVTVSEGAKP